MKNKMIPIPFLELLNECLDEYKAKKSFFGVPVVVNEFDTPIGPAAGPHTQMAQNLVSAYAAGATVFELKTVQILEGLELGIVKPCIYVGSEIYNTEWSTELTVKEATAEYIKAAILIQILSKEFDLTPFERLQFVMSLGYDFDGICSSKLDNFIESMKNAYSTEEWKKDIFILKGCLDKFSNLTEEDIANFTPVICDTVTLSTMHGCPAEDIEKIAKYLLKEKRLNTYIKMNPTLLGQADIERILTKKGYEISLPKEMFEKDIDMTSAKKIISACQKTAGENGLFFGIKLTNTLPVNILNNELQGEQMYMSGPALFALSINTAYLLEKEFEGNLSVSYSGGADHKNILEILEAGIAPVTVSSFLLKPGGYKNLSRLLVKADIPSKIDLNSLCVLAELSIKDENYDRKMPKAYKRQENYTSDCAVCHNCEDICPNRANKRISQKEKETVIHINSLCNECGACAHSCLMGHIPYKEKTNSLEVE